MKILARPIFAPLIVSLLAVALALSGSRAAADELPLAVDLAREAGGAESAPRVLVVLYGMKSCPWCAKVRAQHLRPMSRDPKLSSRLTIREIDIEARASLRDFGGAPSDHRTFAREQGIRFVPVVAFYGANGMELAPPLLGFPSEDFYGAYLEERIDAALARLR